ncbi:carbonic anhydrase [Trametes meyenii]|nr:carbonic anhydrase [Trametes meyenii]
MPQDYILARLLNKNREWAEEFEKEHPGFFEESAKGQEPRILWIGCSDSRVPESVITASRPGDIFVQRNIANQFHPYDDNALSVLTYALSKSVGVTHVIVVGHTKCGGVDACYRAVHDPCSAPLGGVLGRWLAPLVDLVREHPCLSQSEFEEENVRAQVANIAETKAMKEVWAERRVQVHGWMYDLSTGLLRDLDVCREGGPVVKIAEE